MNRLVLMSGLFITMLLPFSSRAQDAGPVSPPTEDKPQASAPAPTPVPVAKPIDSDPWKKGITPDIRPPTAGSGVTGIQGPITAYDVCESVCEAGFACRSGRCLPACPPDCPNGLSCVDGVCLGPANRTRVEPPTRTSGEPARPAAPPSAHRDRHKKKKVSREKDWPRSFGGGPSIGWEYGFGGMMRFGTSQFGGELGAGYYPIFLQYTTDVDTDHDGRAEWGRTIHAWNVGMRGYLLFTKLMLFQPGMKFGVDYHSAEQIGFDLGFAGLFNISEHVGLELNLLLRVFPWGRKALDEDESVLSVWELVQVAGGVNLIFY